MYAWWLTYSNQLRYHKTKAITVWTLLIRHLHLHLFLHFYFHLYYRYQECDKIATPEVVMSEETWKMSFGKFLEISFYNKTARGRSNGCNHCIRWHKNVLYMISPISRLWDLVSIHLVTVVLFLFISISVFCGGGGSVRKCFFIVIGWV